jgi:chitin synthase
MSFLYLDPWHMFTSAGQYFALLPSYICTLQVYAFCNAHDVTWGTKGDNVMQKDLGAAKSNGSGKVELEMPSEQLDIDSGYDEALRNLRDRVEVPSPPVAASQMQEDYYRAVRTYVVIVWMVANAVLAMGVSEIYGSTPVADNFYLKFILWSVACLAMFRALGSTTFLVINCIHQMMEWKLKWMQRRDHVDPLAGATVAGRKVGGLSFWERFRVPQWVGGTKRWVEERVSDKASSIGRR